MQSLLSPPIHQPAPTDRPGPTTAGSRRYDLDWLRVGAVLLVLFYHTGMIYVSWDFHIKSPEHSRLMEDVMRWLHGWRMPLLFFISGAGTFFVLRSRSAGVYARERLRRLLVPLVFGMFVIVPPQIYVEWLFRGRFAGSYTEFYPAVFDFQPYQDGGRGGAFSWHHLWFITYLLLYSLLSIPLFHWLKTSRGQRFTDRLGRLLERPGGALWLAGGLVLNDSLLGSFFPNETHALINDWAYFVKNGLLFWGGYLLTSRRAFWHTLTDQRRHFLAATLVCTLVLYGFRFLVSDDMFDHSNLLKHWSSVNRLMLTWSSVLTTVAYGYRYLNRQHRWLSHLNEAVYPFYVIHQTVVILVGYYVLSQTHLGVYDGFLAVSFTSLAICIALYVLLIRPFKPIRFLFGMKL